MNKLHICADSSNDLAFLSFLRLNICIELAETLWAREPVIYHSIPTFKYMFHKFPTSSGDSTAAAIRKQVRTRPELTLLIVPGISLSTIDAKVAASQHHNMGQVQCIQVKCEALSKCFVKQAFADRRSPKKKPLPGPPSTDSAVGPKGMSLTMRVVKETWAVEGFHILGSTSYE